MQRQELLKRIEALKTIESTKLDTARNKKKKDKTDLHDQKYKGLEMMESRLQQEADYDIIQNTTLCNIIADVIKQYPRFDEGFFNSEIKNFLNDIAPGWKGSIDNKLSSSGNVSMFSSSSRLPGVPETEEKKYKICLLGEAGCGKTAIRKSLQPRARFPETYQATIGVDFIEKQINGINFQVWDLSGNERFTGMLRTYLRCTSAIVFVFDITNPATFDAIKDSWREKVKQLLDVNDAELPKVLVANKIDKKNESHEELIEDAKKYAADNGMQFAEVTAKAPASVENMFKLVGELIKAQEKQNEALLSSDESSEEPHDEVQASRRENCVMM